MKNSSFTLLRALGILVGSLFVATAPFTANDKGLLSFDGIGILAGSMALGLVFIVYGIKGNAIFEKPSPKLRDFSSLLINVLFVAMGLRLIADPERGTTIKIVGCLLLLLGVGLSWVAYASRRSTPAA
jgi:uncharacterized membrane protein HdeD (DUF308 family)